MMLKISVKKLILENNKISVSTDVQDDISTGTSNNILYDATDKKNKDNSENLIEVDIFKEAENTTISDKKTNAHTSDKQKHKLFAVNYEVDKYFDVRMKIALHLNIPANLLHIYTDKSADFRLITELGVINPNSEFLNNLFTTKRNINNIPILYTQKQTDITVELLDEQNVKSENCRKFISGTLYVLPITDLLNIIKSQNVSHSNNLLIIFNGLITILYPRISFDMFTELINNGISGYINKFSTFNVNFDILEKKYTLEQNIFTKTDKTDKTDKNDKADKNIKSVTEYLDIKTFTQTENKYNYNYKLIDLYKVFSEFICDSNIIIARYADTKEHVKLNKDPIVVDLYKNVFKKKLIKLEKYTLHLVSATPTKDIYFVISFYYNLKVLVTTVLASNSEFSVKLNNKINDLANISIKNINKLGRSVFSTDLRYTTLETSGINYIVDAKFIVNKSFSIETYDLFYDYIKSFNTYRLIKINPHATDSFIYYKNPTINTQLLAGKYPSAEYYYNEKALEYYNNINSGYNVEMFNNLFNINFIVKNLYLQDAVNLQTFIDYVVNTFKVSDNQRQIKGLHLNVRDLKNKDPELFDVKKQGARQVYSRKCQKNYQPLAYYKEEISELDPSIKKQAIRYWNFTKNVDMYYVCPNKQYPYLSFIIGAHPKGYCLPCCRKSKKDKVIIEIDGKPKDITDYCLENKSLSKEITNNTKSRYVMQFGKTVYKDRLGELPPTLNNYLLHKMDYVPDSSIIHTFSLQNKNFTYDYAKLDKLMLISTDMLGDLTISRNDLLKYNFKIIVPGKNLLVTNKNINTLNSEEIKYLINDNTSDIIGIIYNDYSNIIGTNNIGTNIGDAVVGGVDNKSVNKTPDKKNKNTLNLINPLYLLKQFAIQNSDTITVKIINYTDIKILGLRAKYIANAKPTIDSKKTNLRKSSKLLNVAKSKYYITGVQQSIDNCRVGILTTLSYYVNKDYLEMFKELIFWYKNTDVNIYLKNVTAKKDVIDVLKNVFLNNTFNDNLDDYINFIIKLFSETYKINVVVIAHENNSVFLKEYLPVYNFTVFVFKRVETITSGIEKINTLEYYPIIKTSIKIYTNNNFAVKKIFNKNDKVVEFFTDITLKSPIIEYVTQTYKNFTFTQHLNKIYIKTEDGYYFYKNSDSNILVFAPDVYVGDTRVTDTGVRNGVYNTFSDLIVMLCKYRKWVFSNSLQNKRFAAIDSHDPLEKEYTPIVDILRISDAYVHDNTVYYITCTDNVVHTLNPPLGKKILYAASKKYSYIFTKDYKETQLKYNPIFINNLITGYKINSDNLVLERVSISKVMIDIWDILDKDKKLYSDIKINLDQEYSQTNRYDAILKILENHKDIKKMHPKIIKFVAYELSSLLKEGVFKEKLSIYKTKPSGIIVSPDNELYVS